MNKYIVVKTFCDKEEIAKKISDRLLKKRLVVGSHITKMCSSFWWEEKTKEIDEYLVEFTTKSNLFKVIEDEIMKIHDYELPAITATEMIMANDDFFNWIDDNIISDDFM